MKTSVLLTLALSALPITGARGQSFTLEQVMGDPFPTALTAYGSGGGGKFAWVADERGVRNIYVAEAPGYQARKITSYDADDGQEVSSLRFAPDGGSIVYVRGDAANRAGEAPNPLSWTTWPDEAVWVVSVSGGEPRKLGEGAGPAVSPKGDRVVWVDKGQVWSAPLSGGGKAEQLFRIRGRAGNLTWSPDGSMLAFESARGDHGFIGVWHPGATSIRYLSPSTDHDGSPAWSPDGKRIAYVRVPNEKAVLPFAPQRRGLPWSLMVADAATGKATRIWTADEGPGSVWYAGDQGGDIYWMDGGRIVFPWEKTGWVHLWSVPVTGGTAMDLTPGDFEIQHAAVTADRSHLVFSSNQDDIDRRHLWRVAAAGGNAQALTRGTGIEVSPVVAGDAVAFLASGPTTPLHPEVMLNGGRQAMSRLPADFPSSHLVTPQQVIFSAADGLPIHGQLFLPPDLKPGEKRPALVFFHGGSRRQMLLGFHYMYYYHNAYSMNEYLASRGYIVLAVNYRSGIGYGLNFREAIDYGAAGASEFRDVQGAGLYLRSRSDVDESKIGVWGGSYGGYLTAMALSRASDLFAAGVDMHGVHDWNVVIKNFVPNYDATAHPDFAKLAYQSSPIATVGTWRSPVLLIQGDDDRNVPFSETVDITEALRRQGVYFEQLVFPDEVHDFLLEKNWVAAYHAGADFFDRMLRGEGPPMREASGG